MPFVTSVFSYIISATNGRVRVRKSVLIALLPGQDLHILWDSHLFLYWK